MWPPWSGTPGSAFNNVTLWAFVDILGYALYVPPYTVYFVSYTIMIVSLHSMPVHNEMDFRPQLNIYTNSNKP